jgi:NTE family protein
VVKVAPVVVDANKKGLALSGGGFRATLYAVGSLARLNEEGVLAELDTITAVSGGAIAAGYLMLNWSGLKFEPIEDGSGRVRATNFHEVIVEPLVAFCSGTVFSPKKGIYHLLHPLSTMVDGVRKQYETKLFGKIKLRDIAYPPGAPEFIFYGTNLDTGVSVRIGRESIRDYHIGSANDHDITLAQAVSISSAFPPFLSPVLLDGSKWTWRDSEYQKLPEVDIKRLRNELAFCDGGLYDNMGLEMLWKHGENKEFDTVFSCDAGAPFPAPWNSRWRWFGNWMGKFLRMSDIMVNQQRALRKRTLARNYQAGEYRGAYWCIENSLDFRNYYSLFATPEKFESYLNLKRLGTQLDTFSGDDNKKLVNWGYLHTDESIRSWYDSSIKKGLALPYPFA